MKSLTARDGYVLTNGEVYGKSIDLGINDSADNWYEITEEEYEIILKEQEEKELIERLKAEMDLL